MIDNNSCLMSYKFSQDIRSNKDVYLFNSIITASELFDNLSDIEDKFNELKNDVELGRDSVYINQSYIGSDNFIIMQNTDINNDVLYYTIKYPAINEFNYLALTYNNDGSSALEDQKLAMAVSIKSGNFKKIYRFNMNNVLGLRCNFMLMHNPQYILNHQHLSHDYELDSNITNESVFNPMYLYKDYSNKSKQLNINQHLSDLSLSDLTSSDNYRILSSGVIGKNNDYLIRGTGIGLNAVSENVINEVGISYNDADSIITGE